MGCRRDEGSVTRMRVSVPDAEWLDSLSDLGLDLLVWDTQGPQPDGHLDLVVWPYTLEPSALANVDTSRVRVIQGQSLGYDGVADHLPPGGVFCNAVGVHEESTAELAVTLALAAARHLDQFARQQAAGTWQRSWTWSLVDKRVMLLGVGGIGREVAARLSGFGCELVRVGTTARDDEHGHVHGVDELSQLLPQAEVVIVAVPLTPQTTGLIDDDFLSALTMRSWSTSPAARWRTLTPYCGRCRASASPATSSIPNRCRRGIRCGRRPTSSSLRTSEG